MTVDDMLKKAMEKQGWIGHITPESKAWYVATTAMKDYAKQEVKKLNLPDIICSCCGKNAPEMCESCISKIIQKKRDDSR